eukprot:TRINITY_DN8807_c0_g1_i2.p1 TRINITY_DN8807_c0_g1~~TRINITY_DN8807_c0_g1_i2.p1  ORF type:complete len:587 (+),score=106.94 TRINITY_DN8807_c0_g1_i2:256-1761(+)
MAPFDFPSTCTNGSFALKGHYMKFLYPFERVDFHKLSDNVRPTARGGPAAPTPAAPVTRAQVGHATPSKRARIAPFDESDSFAFRKLACALESDIPIEMEWAYNVLTVTSYRFPDRVLFTGCKELFPVLCRHAVQVHSNDSVSTASAAASASQRAVKSRSTASAQAASASAPAESATSSAPSADAMVVDDTPIPAPPYSFKSHWQQYANRARDVLMATYPNDGRDEHTQLLKLLRQADDEADLTATAPDYCYVAPAPPPAKRSYRNILSCAVDQPEERAFRALLVLRNLSLNSVNASVIGQSDALLGVLPRLMLSSQTDIALCAVELVANIASSIVLGSSCTSLLNSITRLIATTSDTEPLQAILYAIGNLATNPHCKPFLETSLTAAVCTQLCEVFYTNDFTTLSLCIDMFYAISCVSKATCTTLSTVPRLLQTLLWVLDHGLLSEVLRRKVARTIQNLCTVEETRRMVAEAEMRLIVLASTHKVIGNVVADILSLVTVR